MSVAYDKIRNRAGLVDLENWVRFEVTGPDAVDALDSVVGGNVLDLFEGKAMNTLIPSLDGGVQAILWLIATETGFLVVAEPEEAAPVAEVLGELAESFDIAVANQADTQFHMVLTGPEAEAMAEAALGDDIPSIAFLNAFDLPSGVTAARIGFFGEYELHLFGATEAKAETMAALTAEGGEEIITDQSAFPVMMAEMRILNRARDIADEASVFDAGLQWMIDFPKDNLRGAEALNARRDEASRSCVLMVVDGDAATGALDVDGETVGEIRSAYASETLGKTVALAYIDADLAVPGLVLGSSFGVAETVSAPAFLSKSVTNALGQAA
ncbi:aminomethyltransferase family protein [Tropicibacter sp. R15_0]|uniref:aminomethyltransferase family protein n=1 Tax=Tropicibacter sp. R15_0 TaxID=2821101 RepID=UPI001ADA94FC|nr:aminomethyltransferase family protein [Tropicibacter sp. R15_0]MBO9463671.1 aminomethyltransferase family protein [Tropicibacter sp. R15_0]